MDANGTICEKKMLFETIGKLQEVWYFQCHSSQSKSHQQ